jgi:isoaspartyl peptidase/L-asparaginase-like protein (Ntn-hydrolase superfamily)
VSEGPIQDANEARKVILDWLGDGNRGRTAVEAAVKEWVDTQRGTHTATVVVDSHGNVWFARVHSEYWLADADLVDFVNWALVNKMKVD